MRGLAKWAVLLLLPGAVWANCWQEAGARYGVEPWLLYAIAKKESHMNPGAYGRNADGSYDIGLMQINSNHLPKLAQYGITEASLLDPCTNINVGAWLLSWNFYRNGKNTFSLGAYNAGTRRSDRQEERRQKYANDVLAIYEREVGKAMAQQR
ncbi:lytic transglycosylase domain-containing protein [Crenobacter sp. SG2305]|uniref:lytic transglycosylase domain-containing protein n=1 Tax=Crenobacter oryzisoli TaxID=3056844 RepID=UPI0025AB5A92|nr:lytic transglycosylase domain-containing protein [Crenobacter sp. SG2305]MDN0082358.1 lytic transglycosylase domain-containing protein [Crenobacter sp. SG2305]